MIIGQGPKRKIHDYTMHFKIRLKASAASISVTSGTGTSA
jgi:hypothetical protein